MKEFLKRANNIVKSLDGVYLNCFKYYDKYLAKEEDSKLLDKVSLLENISKTYPIIVCTEGLIIQANSSEWYKIVNHKLVEMTIEEQLELN